MIRYVHGSEDSLDVDVFYLFDKMPSFRECQRFCSDKEENRNIIVVEDGIVVNCFKGTVDEVNNGLYYTYKLHKQEYLLVIERLIERDVLMKMIRVMRCFLSHCSRTQYRSDVKRALKSSSWKEKLEVLKSIDFSTIDEYGKSGTQEDVYKVFAFQLGQFLGLLEDTELYTKSSVGNYLPKLKTYLYRAKNANPKDLIDVLEEFLEIVTRYEIEEKNGIVFFKDFNKKIDLKAEKYVD